MSSCDIVDVEKVTITRGIVNTFVFTVKEDELSTPITIAPTDTFTAMLRRLSDGVVEFSNELSVVDASSGQVQLEVSVEDTMSLEPKRGGEEDRYYAIPNHSLLLVCNTEANGAFIARVPFVYVD